jgi:hypothetical protein
MTAALCHQRATWAEHDPGPVSTNVGLQYPNTPLTMTLEYPVTITMDRH